MDTVFIEAHDVTKFNYGKFMIARFTAEEWARRSEVAAEMGDDRSLLVQCGWTAQHVLVWDLQTGEGSIFRTGGLASYDLNKHAVWVCPMFEPFLEWLYKQDLSDLNSLPHLVDLGPVPVSMQGYRRSRGYPYAKPTRFKTIQGTFRPKRKRNGRLEERPK